jgi:hypothetical protein
LQDPNGVNALGFGKNRFDEFVLNYIGEHVLGLSKSY